MDALTHVLTPITTEPWLIMTREMTRQYHLLDKPTSVNQSHRDDYEEARKSVVLMKDIEHENEYKNPKVRSDEPCNENSEVRLSIVLITSDTVTHYSA